MTKQPQETKVKQRLITRAKLAALAAINSRELPHVIALDGHRYRWVGIGWVDEGQATGQESALVVLDA